MFKITFIYFITSVFCCIQSLSVLEGNTTKSAPQKSSCYCSGVNQVCIDGWCYCAPNYKKNSLAICVYKGCWLNNDCQTLQDWNRRCSGSSCVCDYGYSENWSNGGKCTYDTYHVSTWAWAWIFFVIPAIAVAIYLCLRRRRMRAVPQVIHVQSQPQFQTTSFQQPPPGYANFGPPQQQQPVTVYRY